jgi:wyosine [tRNA(Phe)-imidazoG37] synthetase (radical SAM superfamily)
MRGFFLKRRSIVRYKHLFGPVASRRLGVSLGVDCITAKTCNLNCVYCECGATTCLTNDRLEYVSPAEVLDELEDFLKTKPKLDYITFGGSGEPTLNSGLGDMVRKVKLAFPAYKTALLTNGTLFYIKEVREAVMPFDCVLPSLDAVSEEAFRAVNRPHGDLKVDEIIEGLTVFSRDYRGSLLFEVFIVPSVNDTPSELALFKKVLLEIKPTRVQLNSLDRPGTESSVTPATPARMREIAEFFLPLPVEIISRGSLGAPGEISGDKIATLLSTIKRRPLTIEEIAVFLNRTINDALTLADRLKNDNKIVSEEINRRVFFKAV